MYDNLKDKIRNIPDFPAQGIMFRDITTLLKDENAFGEAIESMVSEIEDAEVDLILGVESRGFIFAAPIAYELGIPFNLIRKPGKLPAEKIKESYTLEYGENILEIHRDAVSKGDRVVICDDLLATGGTALASAKLVERLGGKVERLLFLIELKDLKGRERLKEKQVSCLIGF